jgi:antitoxin component YwqK of YwqJK toxin-antitoxin module
MPNYGFDKIRIVQSDKTVQAEILPVDDLPKTKADRFYFWYDANVIHATQGDFSGKLLNGNYAEYYPSKALKEKGIIKQGLKDGIWLSWYESGILSSSTTWDEGLKSGKFTFFNEKGIIVQAGHYKDNQLNGVIRIYHGKDSIELVTYKMGQPVPIQKKTSIFNKINFFRKK